MKLLTLLPLPAIAGLTAAAPVSQSKSETFPTTSPIAPGEYFKVALYDGLNCTGKYSILTVNTKMCYPFSAPSIAVLEFEPTLAYSIFHGHYGENCTNGWMPIRWSKTPFCQHTEKIKSVQCLPWPCPGC